MSTSPTFVILGTGLAGAKAAETLRAEGFGGRLLLLGDEAERPYDRPPLSKAYLRGETDRDSLYLHQDGFYATHDIELHTSTQVHSIDAAHRHVELASGERIAYDRLLLATGAAPRRLPLPGENLDGIHHLRTRRDAEALAAAAARAEHVVVVGTGWIGSEAAASLRQLGREVTLLGPDTAPLARVLGPEVAGVYRDLHADHGVRLALGTRGRRLPRPRPRRGGHHQRRPHHRMRPGTGRRRRRPPHRPGRGGRPAHPERRTGR
jgi:3-phenylpropionate/trans-cinnamate dioxygenase ferredoxin reductase subunit